MCIFLWHQSKDSLSIVFCSRHRRVRWTKGERKSKQFTESLQLYGHYAKHFMHIISNNSYHPERERKWAPFWKWEELRLKDLKLSKALQLNGRTRTEKGLQNALRHCMAPFWFAANRTHDSVAHALPPCPWWGRRAAPTVSQWVQHTQDSSVPRHPGSRERVHSVMLPQGGNSLTRYFSECIPTATWHPTVHSGCYTKSSLYGTVYRFPVLLHQTQLPRCNHKQAASPESSVLLSHVYMSYSTQCIYAFLKMYEIRIPCYTNHAVLQFSLTPMS